MWTDDIDVSIMIFILGTLPWSFGTIVAFSKGDVLGILGCGFMAISTLYFSVKIVINGQASNQKET